MTGLDATRDTILSVACFVTTARLELLEGVGYEAVIHHSAADLASMNEWCIKTHTASGLVDQCTSSTTDAAAAAQGLLEYIKQHVPDKGKALLAGNSVHADKMFLMHEPWAQILDWLHYRILDVSAIKEAVRRWATDDVIQGIPRKQLKHEAKADILESIEEARYYQSLFQHVLNPAVVDGPGSFGSSSTLDGVYDASGRRLPRTLRTDSYGNTITEESERLEAATKAKRKAAEAGFFSSQESVRSMPMSSAAGAVGRNGRTLGDVGNDEEGFRTDVP